MTKKSRSFIAVDILYLTLTILPILAAIVIRILTKPLSEGISITGAQVYFRIPMPIQDLVITEAQTNSAFVLISILGLCLFMTHGLRTKNVLTRQHLVEWVVEKADRLVIGSMGEHFKGFVPFIAAILALSAFSSLLALVGLFAPTSDINITAGWAILVFILITYYKFKCGPLHYIQAMSDPILLTPLNVISEVATPVSMAFRHYGNVLSGSVISVLIASALQGLSAKLFGWLPSILGEIPFLQVGLPAVLSIYFDVFSGLLQAYIFAMLTMMYVSGGYDYDEYLERQKRKERIKAKKNQQ